MAGPTNAQLLLAQLAKFPSLNKQAVLAVAGGEGLGGGIGDNGTSFGPFQLHEGGALPSSVAIPGAQSWAWSPAGIDYALQGLLRSGGSEPNTAAAINQMVTGFERPANPGAEISGDLSRLGLPNNATGIQGGSAGVPNNTQNSQASLHQAQASHLATLQNILGALMASNQGNHNTVTNLLQNSQALLQHMNSRISQGSYEPSNAFSNLMSLAGRTQPGAQPSVNPGPSSPIFSGQ